MKIKHFYRQEVFKANVADRLVEAAARMSIK